MQLHCNTVKYRIARSLEVRGRGLGDDRLDVELALEVVRLRGDASCAGSPWTIGGGGEAGGSGPRAGGHGPAPTGRGLELQDDADRITDLVLQAVHGIAHVG